MTGPKKSRRYSIRVSSEDYPTVPGRVLFAAGAIRGTGLILDISATGAHVYQPSKNIPQGVIVDLFFLQSGTERRLHAEGEVVRKTDEGFAVKFLRVERELEALVLAAVGEGEPDAGAESE